MEEKKLDAESIAKSVMQELDIANLNMQQQTFVLCYYGNPVAAAEAAGYCSEAPPELKRARLYQTAMRLLKNAEVIKCIHAIDYELKRTGIVNSLELKVHLSEMIRTAPDQRLRLDAMRLLARTFTEFSEKHILEQHKTETKISVEAQLGKLLPHELMTVTKELEHRPVKERSLLLKDRSLPIGPSHTHYRDNE